MLRKRGIHTFDRVMIALLTIIMLLGICFGGITASASSQDTLQSAAAKEFQRQILVLENQLAEAQDREVLRRYLEPDYNLLIQNIQNSQDISEAERNVLLQKLGVGVPAAVDDSDDYSGNAIQPRAGYSLEQFYYEKDKLVFYDVSVNGHTSAFTGNRATRVVDVKLNGIGVNQADSSLPANFAIPNAWKEGTPLRTYYPNATKASSYGSNAGSQTVSLMVTPASGFAVKSILVCCTAESPGSGAYPASPYHCSTNKSGNAYQQQKETLSSGAVTFDVPSYAFGHLSNMGYTGSKVRETAYFILIEVAPITTPIYVQYDFGEIGNVHASFTHSNSDWWLDKSSDNYYGNNGGGVQRPDTQFKYYSKSNETKPWVHKANTLTDSAIKAAESVGYTFLGWKVEHFKNITSDGNPYAFSGKVDDDPDAPTLYAEGANVPVHYHVKLTAQWKKTPTMKLQVEKKVTGLPAGNAESRSYHVQLQKKNGSSWSNVSNAAANLSVTGNNTSAVTDLYTSPLNESSKGTYKVVETKPENDGMISINGTVYTLSTSYSPETITISDSVTTGKFTVTNKYTPQTNDVPGGEKIMVTKTFVGLTAQELTDLGIDDAFRIEVKGDDKLVATLTKSGAVLSNNGLTWTWIMDKPAGNVTITESGEKADGYTVKTDGPTASSAAAAVSAEAAEKADKSTITLDSAKKDFLVVQHAGGTFVWTEETLTGNQRKGIANSLKSAYGEPTQFFSGMDVFGGTYGLIYGGGYATRSGDSITLNFLGQWTKAGHGTYTVTAESPEYSVVNTYTKAGTKITVDKTVEGNMSDRTKDFAFTVSLSGKATSMKGITYVKSSAAGSQLDSGTITGDTYTFHLKHGEKIVFDGVPVGATLTVTEDPEDGKYQIYINSASQPAANGIFTGSVTENMTVSYRNFYEEGIETGVITDRTPAMLMLLAVMAGVVFLLDTKRRQLL